MAARERENISSKTHIANSNTFTYTESVLAQLLMGTHKTPQKLQNLLKCCRFGCAAAAIHIFFTFPFRTCRPHFLFTRFFHSLTKNHMKIMYVQNFVTVQYPTVDCEKHTKLNVPNDWIIWLELFIQTFLTLLLSLTAFCFCIYMYFFPPSLVVFASIFNWIHFFNSFGSNTIAHHINQAQLFSELEPCWVHNN